MLIESKLNDKVSIFNCILYNSVHLTIGVRSNKHLLDTRKNPETRLLTLILIRFCYTAGTVFPM